MSHSRDPEVTRRARQAAVGLAIVVLLALLGYGFNRRAARPRAVTRTVAATPAEPAVPVTVTAPQPERDPFAPTMVTASPEPVVPPTAPGTAPAPVTVPAPSLPDPQPWPTPSEPITERSATLPDIQPDPPPRRRRRNTATLPDISADQAPATPAPDKRPVKPPVKPAPAKQPAAPAPVGEWVEPPAVEDDLQLEGVVVGRRREARLRVKGQSVPAAEGDLVGGYRVERIDRDEVYLTRHGARYRLGLPGGPRVGGSRAPAESEPPKLGPPAPPATGKTS